jgi:hypothetical protein
MFRDAATGLKMQFLTDRATPSKRA